MSAASADVPDLGAPRPGARRPGALAAAAADVHDGQVHLWHRSTRQLWSDVTARPWVTGAVEWSHRRVLDLGCGEGYLARRVLDLGAASVVGVDASEAMVARAVAAAAGDRHQHFVVGDVSSLAHHADELCAAARPDGDGPAGFDVVLAVFVANYLTLAHAREMMDGARMLCRPGAEMVVMVPHPSLPWLGLDAPPMSYDPAGASYVDTDARMEGRLWRFDGSSITVLNHHKRLEDWVVLAASSGWSLVDLAELAVPDSHRDRVEPAQADVPLHLGLRLRA